MEFNLLAQAERKVDGGSGGGTEDEVQIAGGSFEDDLKGKDVEMQPFDRKYFRIERDLIPYEQIKTYQYHISPIYEKQKNGFSENYRRTDNDGRGRKHILTTHPDDDNPDEALEVIDGHNMVREGVSAIIVDGHHRLAVTS